MKKQSCTTTGFFLLLVLAVTLPARSSWGAGVIHVPGDYPTIQAGINAAANEDTVLVAAGTYTGPGNRELTFHSKNIILLSAAGASTTIIDCQGLGRGLALQGNLLSTAVVDGFTITRGARGVGGGISVLGDASPTIRNCRIVLCQAVYAGGGVFVGGSSSPTFVQCTIEENEAPAGGGAKVGEDDWAISADSTIVGDSMLGGGAIITNEEGASRFVGCIIRGNRADHGGGLLIARVKFPALEGCTITGNLANNGGGLMIACESEVINTTGNCPGGLEITGCTVAANHAVLNGGGMFVDCVVHRPVAQTIVWSNCADAQGDQIYTTAAGSVSFVCGDVDGAGVEGGGSVVYDANTIHVDPLFCAEMLCTSAPTSGGEYTLDNDSQALAVRSPCNLLIGAQPQGCTGRTFGVGGGGQFAKIQDAIDRTVGGVGDTVRVAEDTWTGPRNTALDFGGKNIVLKSWGGAASAIIDGGNSVRGIVFQNGESSEAVVEGFTFTRCASTTPGSAVLVEGESSPVIRDCLIRQNDGDASAVCVNSGSPALKSCTIEENSVAGGGGVVALLGGSPSLEECIVRNNSAPDAVMVATPSLIATSQITGNSGAGLYLDATASSSGPDLYPGPPESNLAWTRITDTDISRNADRGAILNGSSAVFKDVVFSENGEGGVIVTGLGPAGQTPGPNDPAAPAAATGTTNQFINCEFSGHSSDRGAGFFFDCTNEPEAPYTVTFTNCRITGNHATFEGGGVAICGRATNADITPVFNNCTITANSAKDGGGVYMGVTSVGVGRLARAEFSRSILWGNCSTVTQQGEAFVLTGNEVTIGCSHSALNEIAGTGVVTSSNVTTGIPAFCDYPGLYYATACQTSATTGGNFGLSPASPAAPANHPCGPDQIGAFPVLNCVPTAIVDRPVPEVSTAIREPVPNPFNPVTSLEFSLKTDSHVTLRVYDANGRLVRTLLDRSMLQGSHRIEWDGRDDRGSGAASGVYFLRFEAGGTLQTRKMVLLK